MAVQIFAFADPPVAIYKSESVLDSLSQFVCAVVFRSKVPVDLLGFLDHLRATPLAGLGASITMHLSFLCSRCWWPPQCGPGPGSFTEQSGIGHNDKKI